ncbi:MAG: hypothetical protein A3C30_02985 [Candidatus Levybacteria bacterium RIFCSPHIGHO2_02_FULL_40_18]|nr:MAG: hypothetical protein A2869_04995 [Candidatus Levybacteria bacterium RIFCSPHIGHO2_01_FULL_40_58]OGH26940.1 MAG: hypothetical protein A3C30_02985 [Candidatus Levybacteria bacterium RIFCSPHIGHO2_02_FULL_40_18]OGH32062.1 MAG: hypothetical protein A3E43_03965 [Candidatus Levybacteria bacterium RIFCSPHIGHO2_12_FULL_40_31]OGH40816.1 MAG: hypothetical protein A2894_04435 [Candidatus Levybacteria bacterium RIFCSPLOWO2_01_FULL_40_64]OGH48672.1 MAG: hypothetical protein A3I54_03365 [Candidatus Lev
MIKLKKGIVSQKVGQKTTIFDGEKSVLYTFNETASFIFDQLKKEAKLEKIVDLMAKKFNVKKETAKNDVEEFVKTLKAKKIVS